MRRVSLTIALAVLAFTVSGPNAFSQSTPLSDPTNTDFENFSTELMAGILSQSSRNAKDSSQTAKDYKKKKFSLSSSKRLRVAIWPFQKNDIPIAKSIADGFNDKLLAALLKEPTKEITFVARDALRTIISDMSQTGVLESDGDPIAALMSKARDVDALIQGRMRLVDGGLSLGYKAVRMDGTILAQTARIVLPLKAFDIAMLNDLLSVDQAIARAAKSFSGRLNEISEIRLGGLHYQDTGLQPPFALFFKDKLVAALENSFANFLTGRKLRILDSQLSREVKLNESLKENKFSKNPKSYLLTGRYWVLNEAVEIRLTLKNPKNYALSWSGRIPAKKVSSIRLKPFGDFADLRENDGLGPFDFQLTTTKGKDPIYNIGEDITLMLRVGENAWTYCFYHQADGKVVQIFPNPHFWREIDTPVLAGGRVHSIPGKKLFPFDLKVTAPAGRELVKCFGASRDITEDLPKELQGRSLSPIARNRIKTLSKLFRSLPYTAISEASLVVTVVK
jgi:hypothetical protein